MAKQKLKYRAIKPEGFDFYIWFTERNIIELNGLFVARNGWGKNGALTSISCYSGEIKSEIFSNELQYT